jgi:hypothetical protein
VSLDDAMESGTVTADVPAGAAEAVVFAGDGQLIPSWGEVLEAADLPPTMIIGAHRAEDETLRLHEYSPGRDTAAFAFDPHRFAAHENDDVRRWAATRLAVRLPVGQGSSNPEFLDTAQNERQVGGDSLGTFGIADQWRSAIVDTCQPRCRSLSAEPYVADAAAGGCATLRGARGARSYSWAGLRRW